MTLDSTSVLVGVVSTAVALSVGYLLGKGKRGRHVVPGNALFAAGQSYGNFVFVSGQLGLAAGSPPKLVDGGVQAQARAAFTHMKRILEESGSSMANVLKCECLLNDIKDYAAFNEVYNEFFTDPQTKPARLCFAPGGLPLGGLVEVQAIAYRG